MKKLKLQTDYSFDFHLIGIISKAKEYSVSWAINESLDIELRKADDLNIETKKNENYTISQFIYENDFLRFSLVSNKVIVQEKNKQKYFIPSLSTFDYLLKIEEYEEVSDLDQMFIKLRSAQNIDSIVKLDVNKIKEKECFIF